MCKLSKTQPRPVAKDATARSSVRLNLTHDPANLVRRSAVVSWGREFGLGVAFFATGLG